jgi:hypothetical protein
VRLVAAIGYTFRGVWADEFIHTGAAAVTNPGDSGAVHIAFPAALSVGGPAVVYDTNLTGRIYRPISGESPVRSIAGNQYTGAVTWIPSPHSTFQYDTVYTAVLNLQAISGYTFAGIGQNVFTHGDAPGAVTNAESSGTVIITFPPTVSFTYSSITSFGPVGAEGSALKIMREKKDDNSLTIDLAEDTEVVIPDSVTLVAGNNSPAKVIINGHNRVLSIQAPGTLVTVGGGVTLTLRNITLRGYNGNNAPLVTVGHGGKLILGTGVTLTGNKTTADAGGVWVNGGELVLNNGAVIKEMEAQRGGGALIDANGKLNMNGGTIGGELSADGNTVSGENGGGGVLVLDGSFNMVGGAIQSNSAEALASAGGVLVVEGSFGMFEGTIQSNSAAAAASAGGVGVLNRGAFSLYNGTIKGNEARSAAGAESGGAVILIEDTSNYYSAIGRFTMYGGTIGGENSGDANTAVIGANGVCVSKGAFTMAGGTIKGNTGGGNYSVLLYPANYGYDTLMMRGAAMIDKDDRVFLSSGVVITLGGALSASSPAANIIYADPGSAPNSGTVLLQASSPALITGNIDKFLYNDTAGLIVYYTDTWSYYGVYQ